MARTGYPRPEYLSKTQLAEEAELFLREFWPSGLIPVDIETIVDVGAELDVVTAPGIFQAYGIDGFLANDMSAIYVDEHLSSGPTLHRYRFTLAHEIGHWYLHEDLYLAARYEGPNEFLRFRSELPADDLAWYEWQARQFAGLVLAPPEALRLKVQEAVAFAKRKGLDTVDLSNEAHRDFVAEWIGRRLEVSADVVRRRGADDGFWDR
jgi:Zn-dependent peptidase ImmA (M78 family)